MSTPVPTPSLRCAIIGLGDWAWRHVRLLRETPGFELTAVSSRSDKAAARAAAELPGVAFFRDHTVLLREARPDFVIITTPHYLHAPMAIEALRAGAHVMVEKPLAITIAEAKAMIAEARAVSRTLAVYHNRRFDPWLLAAKSAVDQGLLGRLADLHVSWPMRFGPDTWRGRNAESGGQFFDLGAHIADWALVLAGSAPVSVSGHLYKSPDTPAEQNEDHASVVIRFENGLVAHVSSCALDTAPARRFHLVGEKATLTDDWNWGGGTCKLWTRSASGNAVSQEIPYGGEDDSAGRRLYQNLAAHFQTGAPLAIPPEQALLIIAILIAAKQSSDEHGRWIHLADVLR